MNEGSKTRQGVAVRPEGMQTFIQISDRDLRVLLQHPVL